MDLGGRELQRQRAGLDCEVAECKQFKEDEGHGIWEIYRHQHHVEFENTRLS
jgi:hypothetical protein